MRQYELFGAPSAAAPPPAERGDALARRRAVSEFGRPLLLEAGAGTGKTATLVARVVHWCLGPGWEGEPVREGENPLERAARVLSGVAAMTFTEAAAAEMSSRVGRALTEVEAHAGGRGELPPGCEPALLPQDPGVLAARARALRGMLDHLNVSTIHAFCRRILSAHPLEAGLRAGFEVDATLQQAELAVRDALAGLLREDWEAGTDGDWIALARLRAPPPAIEAAAVALVAERGARSADFLEHDPLPEDGCARAVGSLATATAEFVRRARELATFRSKSYNTRFVLEALDDTERALAECGSPSQAALIALVPRLRAAWTHGERAKGWAKLEAEWPKKGLNQGEGRAVSDHDGFLAAATALRAAAEPFLGLDPGRLALVRRVIGRVLERAESLLRARGIATFSDLLSGACALLSDPQVAARERSRIRQLLVDEFQDTDEEQCEIVARLGLEGSARPGLFVVGDPKQSIFAWRNADLAAYDDFAERLAAEGGERLTLDANFRSHVQILEEVERVIGQVMESRRGLQPTFVPLQPAHPRARSELERPAVEHWISWTRDPTTGELVTSPRNDASYASEARALARDIAERRANGVQLSDCAVILRGMTGVETYLRELRAAGVPYEVQSDRRYYQRREVQDAAALVRAVLDPTDHAALVALLRSPAVGLPDAALLALWAEGFPGEMTRLAGWQPKRLARLSEGIAAAGRRVPASVPGLAAVEGWTDSLRAAVESIARLRASFAVEALDRFVEALRAELLSDAAEAARYLGEFRLANLERFFCEVLRALEKAGGDPRPMLTALRANLGRQDRNEVSRPGDARRDAVQVLTIHAAKGLEFGHVYLMQTHRGRGGEASNGAEFERRGGQVAYRVLGAASLAWVLGAEQRDDIEAAERVRLLYVMLTRAAERLVVAGVWPEDVAPRPWRRAQHANDLYRWRPGAADAVAAVARAARGGSADAHVDAHGVAWRLAEREPGTRGVPGTRPKLAMEGVRAAAREARGLIADRVRAERRMARPFSVAASAEAHVEASELAASRPSEGNGSGSPSGAGPGRSAARAAGTAVHRLLQELPLEGDLVVHLRSAAERLPALILGLAPIEQRAAALARSRELVERIAAGGLLERLARIGAARIVARELPVLVPPEEEGTGAVGFVSGAVDLVYREEQGELVVVDYKTDLAETEAALAELALAYRTQGAAYAEAVGAALGLEYTPRFELWFLHAGRVLVPSS